MVKSSSGVEGGYAHGERTSHQQQDDDVRDSGAEPLFRRRGGRPSRRCLVSHVHGAVRMHGSWPDHKRMGSHTRAAVS